MLNAHLVSLKNVRPGQIIVDFTGKSMLSVSYVRPSRQAGYVVVFGEGFGHAGASQNQMAGRADKPVYVR